MINTTGLSNIVDDNTINLFSKGLRNNIYKYHQFYNMDIDANHQHFIRFMLNYNENKKDKFINKSYYDIEVVGDGETFPDPEKVEFPVTSIAAYNSKLNIVYIWALVDHENCNITSYDEILQEIINMYENTCNTNEIYRVPNLEFDLRLFDHPNDKDLLMDYFETIRQIGTVMLMGFNSQLFDDAYIMNRAKFLFGESYESIVSEFNQVSSYGNSFIIPDYEFVDLLKLYQPVDSGGSGFGQSLSNYKLDTIVEEELEINKLDFEGNFLEYYRKNIAGFLTYNIFDTVLLYKLDQKLLFTELILDLAKYNNSTFGASIGGRSIMYQIRNHLHYSKKNELIRSKLFSQEVLYGFE